MRRRTFLASAGLVGGSGAMLGAGLIARPNGSDARPTEGTKPATVRPLTAPSSGAIPVAVVVSTGVTVIDFCGPWEVFQDVHVSSRGMSMEEQMPFRLFTVSSSTAPVRGSGGLAVVPDYTFETAPSPKVVVVPAQGGGSPAMYEWLRKVTESTDVTMSVCTGAFILAKAGLLAGKSATTHHDFFDDFAARFPDVHLSRGVRFVENDRVSTAGGLTSGIDLALHVVERYFGRDVAERTAAYMEYQGQGWKV